MTRDIQGEKLIRRLPKGDEFSDIWDTLDNMRATADNDFVSSLPGIETLERE